MKLFLLKLITSTFVLFPISVLAQSTTTNIDFNGFIPTSCQFTGIQDGELIESGNTLITNVTGKAVLSCNSALANLDIATPTQSATNPLQANSINYFGTVGPNNISSTNVPSLGIPIGINTVNIELNLDVNNFVGNPPVLTSGNYSYTIQLTANPN